MKYVLATAAVAAAAGLALAGVPAASAATTRPARAGPPAAVRPLVRAQVTLPRTHLPHLTPGKTTATSGNWSGWADSADSGVALRYVQSDWNIPSVNCAGSTLGTEGAAYNSDWVGLDGFGSDTVEQTGTTAYCDGSATPSYDAWYEMYPLAPVAFSGVSPGDAVDAAVYFNGSSYNISLTDLTTGGEITTTQPCPSGSSCKNSSAEVIVEDPGDSAPGLGLADFGQVNFTNSQVTSRDGTKGTLASGSLWTATSINMVDQSNNDVLATAGPLEGGAAFADTWVQSL
jgi:hypothetical protein